MTLMTRLSGRSTRFEDTYPQKAGAVFGLVLNTPVFFKNLKEKVWG